MEVSDSKSQNHGDEDNYYPFQIVQFITRGPKSQRSVDIIPSSWISFNKKKWKLETKFPPPPYTEETTQILHHLVRNKLPPIDSWSAYSLILIGGAKTYEEGVSKSNDVKNDDSLFYTEDSDFNAQEKAALLTKTYKEMQKQADLPKLPSLEGNESSSASSTQSDSSSENKKQIKKLVQSKRIKSKNVQVKKRSQNKGSKGTKIKSVSKIKSKVPENAISDPEKSTQLLSNTSKDDTHYEVLLDQLCPNLWSINDSNDITKEIAKTNQVADDNNKNGKGIDSVKTIVSNDPEAFNPDAHQLDQTVQVYNETEANMKIFNINNPKASCSSEVQNLIPEEVNNNHKKQQVKDPNKKQKTKIHTTKETEISADASLILAAIKGLSVQTNDLSNKLDSQAATIQAIAAKIGLSSSGSFILNNNLVLPFKDVASFKEFNEKLEDNTLCEEFICSLTTFVDFEHIIAKSALNIIKKYFSKELALQFTNIRKSGKKLILKEFKFHQCVVDALTRTHTCKDGSKVSIEKSAIDAIGSTLAYARDWEGGRKERDESSKKD